MNSLIPLGLHGEILRCCESMMKISHSGESRMWHDSFIDGCMLRMAFLYFLSFYPFEPQLLCSLQAVVTVFCVTNTPCSASTWSIISAWSSPSQTEILTSPTFAYGNGRLWPLQFTSEKAHRLRQLVTFVCGEWPPFPPYAGKAI